MRISLTHGPREANSDDEVTGITLTLSRRNLEALTKMLDDGRAAGALNGRDKYVEILVQAQEDEVHYAERAAGSMSWERGDAPSLMVIECGTDDLFPTDAA